ncbi:MAG: HD domain-containing protein, partial [Thermoplasmata archaeon]|nr:HD domain-containing protein [Thermoplasmata archaeon]
MSRSVIDPVLNVRIILDERETALLDHPRVRRLGGIKQNGFAYLRFPRATHTRHEHSLGVVYWATLMHRTLLGGGSGLAALRMAALLHDVGHGPFSHALEVLLGRNPAWRPIVPSFGTADGEIVSEGETPARGHEDLTLAFVGSELAALEPVMAADVLRILSGEAGILSSILSSDVDADRMDYLIRDAHYSGIPFGRDLGTLFRSVVEGGMAVEEKAGREWIVVSQDAIRGIEMVLAARFASYRTIYHDTLSRTADSMFVSSIESALAEADDPRASVLALFTAAADIDFHEGRSDDPLVDQVVKHPAVRGMMDSVERIEPWPERRLVTFGRGAIYSLIKVLENGRTRELERGLGMVLNRPVTINVSMPNTLSPDLMVDDASLNPEYRPALLYDYSPLVKALEDAMYVTATVQTNLDLGPAMATRSLEGLLASTSRADADTFRDVVSAAILDYLELAAGPADRPFTAKAMQRRSTAVFGAAGRALSAAGI